MARIQLSGTQIPTLSKLNVDGEFTLDAASGTTGQILISQGAGNTPAWTSTLTGINGLTSDTAGSTLTVSTGSRTAANTGNLQIQTGTATTSGSSGFMYLDVGSVNSGQTNGIISIGSSPYALSNGNVKSLYLGNSSSTTTVYGTLVVPSTINTSLSSTIKPVAVSGTSGYSLTIAGGNTSNTNGIAGDLNLTGGAATDAFGLTTGGTVYVTGGSANTSSAVGGSVVINGGLASGSSANGNGSVYIGSGNTETIQIGTNGGPPIYIDNLYQPAYRAYINVVGVLTLNNSSYNQGASNPVGSLVHTGQIYQGNQFTSGTTYIPNTHLVFSQANSSSSNTTTAVNIFAAANDVLGSLEPAKLYRFKAKIYSTLSYGGTASGISIIFGFSNAPTVTKYTFTTYPTTTGTATTSRGVSTTNAATTIVPSVATSGTWVTDIDGYFQTHAVSNATFTPQFACTTSAGGTSATINTGSYIEIEKLGASGSTKIAGNWA